MTKDWLDEQVDELNEAFEDKLFGDNMRTEIIRTLEQHFTANIQKHKMNVDIMLNNPMAIHDHTDLMGAIEKEIDQISEYMDKLEVLEKYFKEQC